VLLTAWVLKELLLELVDILTSDYRSTQCNASVKREGKAYRCHHQANYVVHGSTQHLRLCKFHASTLAKELAQELFQTELVHWYEKETK